MKIEESPGKETWLCYFDQVEAALCNDKEHRHRSKGCGALFTQNNRSGFENLKKHVKLQHQDCIQKVYLYIRESAPRGMMDNWLRTSTNKTKNVYDLIDWIVVDNLPFLILIIATTRRKSKLTL